MSVEFRGAVVEIVYRAHGDDDVLWEFAERKLNEIPLSAIERQDIRREALAHAGRG
jgi:hypothetical protein